MRLSNHLEARGFDDKRSDCFAVLCVSQWCAWNLFKRDSHSPSRERLSALRSGLLRCTGHCQGECVCLMRKCVCMRERECV